MKIIGRRTVIEGKHLKFVEKDFRTNSGKNGIWETVERKNIYHKGAVIIVALTKKKQLILEKNWRVPSESFVIQFPAGLSDKKGESEEEAARRELLEETGYQAKKLIPIISAPASPALTSTRVSYFFAPEVEYTGNTNREDAEEIEVLKIPIKKIGDFLSNLPEGTELDLKVPGILWILERKNICI